MYIIIVGCGNIGSHIANQLSRLGHSIVVLDKEGSSFEKLSTEFSGFKYEGDATEFSILKQAKIEKADWLLTVTDNDNINIMVAQIAKSIFNLKNVIARVNDPQKQSLFEMLDILTVCPSSIAVDVVMLTINN